MRFQRIYIEITNRCNLSCPFCSRSSRPLRDMTLSEFEKVVSAIRPYTDYVYFHVKGEPLLHPDIIHFLSLCHQLGLQVNLTTNAVLLPSLCDNLLASPALRQVNLSLHGYTPSAHGSLTAYLDFLIDFSKRAAQNLKYTAFRVWTLNGERNASPLALEILSHLSNTFPNAGDLTARRQERAITLAPRIFLSFEEEFVWPSLQNPPASPVGFCHGGRRMLAVLSDGTVTPCCLDGEGDCPLGNLFTQSMDEVLASPTLSALADGFSCRKVTQPLCLRCGYRTRFDKLGTTALRP